jgi:hypothetical protein
MYLCACVSDTIGDGEGAGCHSEESERGEGAGVNATMLFATLQVVVLADAARTAIILICLL